MPGFCMDYDYDVTTVTRQGTLRLEIDSLNATIVLHLPDSDESSTSCRKPGISAFDVLSVFGLALGLELVMAPTI